MRLIDVSVLKEWVENWFTKNRLYHPYAKNNNIPITELYDILEQMPSAQPERNGWVHIDDIYRLISGHSNYHGDNILAALTCLAEGKEVLKPITVLDAQPERKRMTNKEWIDFLSEQFSISRTSAREMLHGMMQWKKEDNFKKQFNRRWEE